MCICSIKPTQKHMHTHLLNVRQDGPHGLDNVDPPSRDDEEPSKWTWSQAVNNIEVSSLQAILH